MNRTNHRSAAAFTLIELLAVIGIIGLLLGILIPAINNARDQAKAGATRAMLKSISDGCEMFHGEMNKYPQSRGENPYEGDATIYLSGAQWLVVQLCGPDLQGYVKPVKQNDSDGVNGINHVDWRVWYDKDAARDFTRLGPFVQASGELAQTPRAYRDHHPYVGEIPDSLDRVSSDVEGWDNGQIPFFVDSFGYPVLYYKAEPYAKQVVTTGLFSDPNQLGIYDQTDNASFTGSLGGYGFYIVDEPGWDLGAGRYRNDEPRFHELGVLGYPPGTVNDPPDQQSFTYSIYDRNLYEATDKGNGGRVAPLRKDTFMLISPGVDARYGTLDDVRTL